jgi:hypothetical protein
MNETCKMNLKSWEESGYKFSPVVVYRENAEGVG